LLTKTKTKYERRNRGRRIRRGATNYFGPQKKHLTEQKFMKWGIR